MLPFFVLISILEVYFSAYCFSLFSSVYLKYASVHTAFLFFSSVYLKYTSVQANANKTALYFKYTSPNMQSEPDLKVWLKYTPSAAQCVILHCMLIIAATAVCRIQVQHITAYGTNVNCGT